MRIVLTILTGFLLLVLESVFVGTFHIDTFLPHVACGLMIYLALQKELFEGGIEATLLAWTADLLGGAPPGVIALGLALIFFTIRLTAQRLSYRSVLVRAALSIVVAAALQTIMLLILLVVLGDLSLIATYLLAALPSALTAPIGLFLTWGPLSRIDGLF